MTTFNDLKFEPHQTGDGKHALIFFGNGYGASVVRFAINGIGCSYGYDKGLWELAVIEGNEKKWELAYRTPVTNDVVGHLSKAAVTRLLGKIETLPKAQ